jgi:nitrogen fixation-related uncharacterized protein
MHNNSRQTNPTGPNDRWSLARDIAVLQVKLVVDGLRDFVLVPVSMVAGLIGLVKFRESSGSEFYDLLRVGKKSERWINLFAAVENLPEAEEERIHFPDEDIDALVSRVESYLVDEYQKGGVTKQARDHLHQLLNSVNRRRQKKNPKEQQPQ